MNILVFTGAGISRESGLNTFRDSDGLWEGHRVEDVATPEAWRRDPQLVLEFYNQRRRDVRAASPNFGHLGLAELEREHHVTVVTQNIDDLHERAGSSRVIHLHGEILFGRSVRDASRLIPWEGDMRLGDLAPDGGQVRPHVVWFGEEVTEYSRCARMAMECDAMIVVGTSLAVYPAAGLVDVCRAPIVYFVDPKPTRTERAHGELRVIEAPASEGIPRLVTELMTSSR
jgi:NAD-dependent deacetylase